MREAHQMFFILGGALVAFGIYCIVSGNRMQRVAAAAGSIAVGPDATEMAVAAASGGDVRHEQHKGAVCDAVGGASTAGGQQMPYAWVGGMDPNFFKFLECWAAQGGSVDAWFDCKEKIRVRDNAVELVEADLYADEGERYCNGPCGSFEIRLQELYDYWTRRGGREQAAAAVAAGREKRATVFASGV